MRIKPFLPTGSVLLSLLLCASALADNAAAPTSTTSPTLLELPATPVKPMTPAALPAVVPAPVAVTAAQAVTPAVPATLPTAPPATLPTAPIAPPAAVIPASPQVIPSAPAVVPVPIVPAPQPTPPTSATTLPAIPGGAPANVDSPLQKKYDRPEFLPKLLTIDPSTKLQVLEAPVNIAPDFSLMFSEKDMTDVVIPSLSLYDKSLHDPAQAGPGSSGDDLTSLIESLRVKGDSKQTVQQKEAAIPNLYLGSILYYSPSNWSVWVNGKKIVNRLNNQNNVMYVREIHQGEVTLVWHPTIYKDMRKHWNERNVMPQQGITLNDDVGTLTFTLHPNQTFLAKTLQIREGLIIAHEPAIPAMSGGADATAAGKAPGASALPATPSLAPRLK